MSMHRVDHIDIDFLITSSVVYFQQYKDIYIRLHSVIIDCILIEYYSGSAKADNHPILTI